MITIDFDDVRFDAKCFECGCRLTPENQMTSNLQLKGGPVLIVPILLCVECIDAMREGEIGRVYRHVFAEIQSRLTWETSNQVTEEKEGAL